MGFLLIIGGAWILVLSVVCRKFITILVKKFLADLYEKKTRRIAPGVPLYFIFPQKGR